MSMIVKNMSFKEGQEMKINAKPKSDCERFAINIGHDSDNFALHLNPRFDGGYLVCNSLSGGSWGDEEHNSCFPFQQGEENKIVINFNMEEFFIKLPDGSMMSFPNRLGDVKYRHIEVAGDVRIISIKIK